MRVVSVAVAALGALALSGCYAPLEYGGGARLSRGGLGWQARIGFHPLGLVRDAIHLDADVGLGVAYQSGTEHAWLFYLQGTTVVWRHDWSEDAAARWRAGGELRLDLTHERAGFGLVTRLDPGIFVHVNGDGDAFWGELAGGLLLVAAYDDALGPSIVVGADLRMPAGATRNIPDRM